MIGIIQYKRISSRVPQTMFGLGLGFGQKKSFQLHPPKVKNMRRILCPALLVETLYTENVSGMPDTNDACMQPSSSHMPFFFLILSVT
jgi:hypothetical protein